MCVCVYAYTKKKKTWVITQGNYYSVFFCSLINHSAVQYLWAFLYVPYIFSKILRNHKSHIQLTMHVTSILAALNNFNHLLFCGKNNPSLADNFWNDFRVSLCICFPVKTTTTGKNDKSKQTKHLKSLETVLRECNRGEKKLQKTF